MSSRLSTRTVTMWIIIKFANNSHRQTVLKSPFQPNLKWRRWFNRNELSIHSVGVLQFVLFSLLICWSLCYWLLCVLGKRLNFSISYVIEILLFHADLLLNFRIYSNTSARHIHSCLVMSSVCLEYSIGTKWIEYCILQRFRVKVIASRALTSISLIRILENTPPEDSNSDQI